MKTAKKVFVLIVIISALFLTACGKKEEKMNEKIVHEKNPIATMLVEYKTADGEEKSGLIKLELYANEAPDTVANFVNLVQNNFYDGLTFHRIVDNFMIQGGDPKGTGAGGAKVSDINKSVKEESSEDYRYSIKGEFANNNFESNIKFEAGTIAMARSDYSAYGMKEEGYNSGCSQFFIVNTDDEEISKVLQGNYAAFGKVIEGYNVVEEISKVKVQTNMQSGEVSTPEVAPIIKSISVETFGEEYPIPELINADEVTQKVNQEYLKLLQRYYQQNSGSQN